MFDVTYVPVDKYDLNHAGFLYLLLSEREPNESISHKEMPTFIKHQAFILSEPYDEWWLITDPTTGCPFGAVYITKARELGIGILKAYRRSKIATIALEHFIKSGAPYFANINPANQKSIYLFEKAGFKHIQNTYRLD